MNTFLEGQVTAPADLYEDGVGDPLKPADDRVMRSEMVENDDSAVGFDQPLGFTQQSVRFTDHADGMADDNPVETGVGKWRFQRVAQHEVDVIQTQSVSLGGGLTEHPRRKVHPDNFHIAWVVFEHHARPDAEIEHMIVGLWANLFECAEMSFVDQRAEGVVVNLCPQIVELARCRLAH